MTRTFLSVFALLVIVTVTTIAAPNQPVLVELNDAAAFDAREHGVLPTELTRFNAPDMQVTPIFYEPNDPEHRASWYDIGLNRWFKVQSSMEAQTLLSSLNTGGAILSAELDQIHDAMLMPDDIDIYNMWALDIMECPEAWDIHQDESDVIITTIDTGCKISHEDLWANMYINPGEDLNNNGVWDDTDINGIDDDNNGFVDDLTGWDFVSGQPWGDPAVGEDYGPRDNEVFPDVHGHGTHVQGTAAATTNNGIGVASASWNVISMPLRAGFAWLSGGSLQGSGISSDFMAAIQYATDNGSRVISISFGGSGSQQAYQDAVTYARENGVILFASAGNNGDAARNYPAAYEGAIAVVASTPEDYKAGFSTYGDWVGITAPGTSIWSTMVGENYRPQDYVAWQGTSMASPNAASVAALILSYMPELTDDQVEFVIKAAADDIDHLNPSYVSLLGAGRVNARRALEYAPSATVPMMDYVNSDVNRENGEVTLSWYSDPGGNNDFNGYNVYRDGNLILEATMLESTVDQLPEPGDYTYTVRALYGDIESLPMNEPIFYSGIFGLPIVDDFESENPEVWEYINSINTYRFTSRVYNGEYSVGTSAPANIIEGVQRYFAETNGLQVSTWFYLSGYPSAGGEAGSVHLFSGDERIKLFVGNNHHLWLQDPDMDDPVQLTDVFDVDYNRWYHLSLNYQDGELETTLLNDEFQLRLHDMRTVADLPIDGALFGSRDLNNGWSFFDVVTVKPFPTDLDHFTPVAPNEAPYPIVISGGLPQPLTDYEIAVLDGGTVVGAISPDHDVFPLILNAYEDLGNGGFTPGNPMTFEIWNTVENTGETLQIGQLHAGDGNFGSGNYTRLSLYAPSGVDDQLNSGLPREFEVGKAYPNPFNPSFAVNVAVPSPGEVRLALYNVLGQRVLTQARTLQPGYHTLTLSASDAGVSLATGVYVLQVQHAGQRAVQKVVLTK
ncbi:S8 family serine peptidase [bacterium]|nr:S8 family serine peptidase [bacterium]